MNLVSDIYRRQTNRHLLTLLEKGICPSCNESAVHYKNGIYECHHCHSEFQESYTHPPCSELKPSGYK